VSVVRTTFKVYGKRQILTLSQTKTPEPIVTKFEWRDYVVNAYHQKIWAQSSQGLLLPYRWNIHPSCSKFISRHFFGAWTRLQTSPLDCFLRLIRQMTRFCARKCFYCYKMKILFIIYLFEKFEKWQWRLWGKFKNSLNCHNFGCVQDRIVILVLKYGFRRRPN